VLNVTLLRRAIRDTDTSRLGLHALLVSSAAIQCFQPEAIASVSPARDWPMRLRYRLKSIVGITSAMKRARRAVARGAARRSTMQPTPLI